MKVDIPSLIIGIVALATFCVPIAWYQISEKLKVKKLNSELKEYAQKELLELDTQEVWGHDYAVGLDRDHKKLLYLKHEKNGHNTKVIELSEVEKCKVTNGKNYVRTSNGTGVSASNIRLNLYYKDPQKAATSLEIYDGTNGKTLTSELAIANKLARLIRPLISNSSKTVNSLPVL